MLKDKATGEGHLSLTQEMGAMMGLVKTLAVNSDQIGSVLVVTKSIAEQTTFWH